MKNIVARDPKEPCSSVRQETCNSEFVKSHVAQSDKSQELGY